MSLPDQKKANVEKMFFEGQLLVIGLNPTPTVKMQAMGWFACNLILAILDKRHKDLPKFGCLEDCGCQLVEYLRSLGLHVPRSPWADHRQAEPKQAAKKARTSADGGSSFLGGRKLFIECNGHNSKGDKVADTCCKNQPCLRLRPLDSSGRIENSAMLVDAGFGVGMHVKRKIDKVEGVIKGMTATQVNIEVGGNLKAVSADSFLKGDWRPVAEKVAPEPLLGWVEVTPERSYEFWVQALKAKIMLAMHGKMGAQSNLKIDIFAKPRMVTALKSFKTDELKLPITTLKIDIKEDGSKSMGSLPFCIGSAVKD